MDGHREIRWARSLTKLSREPINGLLAGGIWRLQHDLPLQHPNFAFVNCQRKTKYEEIIGDCVGFGHEGYQQLVPPIQVINLFSLCSVLFIGFFIWIYSTEGIGEW
ncbi:hypothetical protein DVH24_025634 [Malus domestica]|uniref:Uncharacterized protein n=1 Tax=Malus domestica TaxID=3750 RepID=A0A498KFT4_MALDO|nr:hypothetical protein DVH24_025634 [Malus domestica]